MNLKTQKPTAWEGQDNKTSLGGKLVCDHLWSVTKMITPDIFQLIFMAMEIWWSPIDGQASSICSIPIWEHSCTYFCSRGTGRNLHKSHLLANPQWSPAGFNSKAMVIRITTGWLGLQENLRRIPKKWRGLKSLKPPRLWSFCKNVSEFQAHLSAEMTIANVVTRRQINSKFNGRIWRMPTLTIINHIWTNINQH